MGREHPLVRAPHTLEFGIGHGRRKMDKSVGLKIQSEVGEAMRGGKLNDACRGSARSSGRSQATEKQESRKENCEDGDMRGSCEK